jgi:heme/copper-type cytochrome/quinol oxidase subunit 2
MEAGSFYYSPNEIRVKKGETVKIVMKSVDMMHDFNIDELDVKLPITKSGETNSVEFTADTVGEFEFYCSVGQHRANGQVGTLIVEE